MRPGRLRVLRLGFVVVVLASVAGVPGAAMAADGQDAGTPLSVTITDGATPPPGGGAAAGGGTSSTGGGTSAGGGASTGGSSTGAGSGGAGVTSGTGSAPSQPDASGEVSVAGMLYVGGLNGSTTPSVNPADGLADLWFTIRNASSSIIDASAEFSIDGALFSNRLDTAGDVAITGLQPGETRVVSVSLHGAGQWTLLTGHVTVTPPESVDGTALSPVTRDGFFLLFPWLIVLIAVVLVLAWAAVRVVRSALPPVPAVVTS